MRVIRNKLIRLLVVFASLFVLLFHSDFFEGNEVLAAGDFWVDWGVARNKPLFEVNNFMPGESVIRQVKVENNGKREVVVAVRSDEKKETGGLDRKLFITVKQGAKILYGPTSLDKFFQDSGKRMGITLSHLGSGKKMVYVFSVTFDPLVKNRYQDKIVVFDLKIGSVYKLPKKRSRFEKFFDWKKCERYEDEEGEYELDFEEEVDDARRGFFSKIFGGYFWR
jgi:hypothetical protein